MIEPNQRPSRFRLAVLAITTVVVLALVNLQIVGKELIVKDGTTVLLRLAPEDPRSLLQGDYMALRYAMASRVASAARDAGVDDGRAVIALDDGRARFETLYEGQTLERNQHLLKFRKRGDSVRLASDAYFFEEGTWATYSNARFGELRVADDGEAVLIGLRDGDGRRLGEALVH